MSILNNPRWFWKRLTKTKLYNYLPDKIAVKIKYRNHFFKKLDLNNPRTFSEKLQWLKLFDRKPEYTIMADKLLSKEYVSNKIGKGHVIPVLGVWDSFNDIDFDSLPDQFVLKCTHSSGDTVICKDKAMFDKNSARGILEKSLKTDYYLISREWSYKNISRKIIAEEYLEDGETHEARDYKFFCFGGKVRCFKVDFGRFKEHHANWYSPNGRLLKYGEQICPPEFSAKLILPNQIEEMIKMAEKLSEGIPFLRVDFYCINGRIYVGELTFYPASGLLRFTDDKWDRKMGKWLVLPKKQTKGTTLEKELLKDIIREEKKIYIGSNPLYLSYTHSKRYIIWKFLSYYRKSQYYREKLSNTGGVKRLLNKVLYWYFSRRKNVFSEKCGIEIANGCRIGRRIRMWHGGIVINAHVGDDCLLHGNNILGNKGVPPYNQIPTLGNHVDVGAGAVIIDSIVIADYCKIGANSFVNKSFLQPNSVIVGIPARILKNG